MTAEAARTDARRPAGLGDGGCRRSPAPEAGDWQRDGGILEASAIDCSAASCFCAELPGQIESVGLDRPRWRGTGVSDGHHDHCQLTRYWNGLRRMRGKVVFAGHTRNLEGFLRTDFGVQNIKSFLSVSVFAHGLWGIRRQRLRQRADGLTEEEATLHIIALAIGDAIERSLDAHASEVIRRTMLQASLDAIIVIDETGSIIEFNPAAEKMFASSAATYWAGSPTRSSRIRRRARRRAPIHVGRGSPMVGQRLRPSPRNAAGGV
jgi:PAS domain-containing protein